MLLVTCAGLVRSTLVIGRQYFTRQAAALLKFAQSTADPRLEAVLIEKAADLKSVVDELSAGPDPSPKAPDVRPAEYRRTLNS
jgi:hypothetical protein